MLLDDFCRKLPGRVLGKRAAKEEIPTPKAIKFLLAPCTLEPDVLYLADSALVESCLPSCHAPLGSTVLCSGEVPRTLSFQVNINFVAVDCGLLELYNHASDYMTELYKNENLEEEDLRRKFSEIVEHNYTTDYQVDSICATFPQPFKSSYCVICIESEEAPGKAVRDRNMREELRRMFPEDNITTFDNNTVVIHSYDGFTHPPKLPLEQLSELLRKYRACAGVSNGIRKPSALRVMYILSKRAMESGKTLMGKDKNVFIYDETMLFSVVALAASSFREQFDNDDIILLGSPILANIIKHDPNGKRGLVETMFQYISNGGSTSKTAEVMHMHRNTVKNRIALIEKIAGEPFFVDGMLSAKLLTTYYIMQYYTKVWNKNMKLSPLKKECDTVVQTPEL